MAGAEGYYRHSGQFSPVGLMKGILIGLLVGAIGAPVVAYAQVYIPLVIINFIFSAGFGAIVGLATASALTSANTRNTFVGLVVALLATAISYYVCWAIWVNAHLARADVEGRPGLVKLILDPEGLWTFVSALNRIGVWSIKRSTPTGGALWAVWGIEAAVVFGLSLWAANEMLGANPFCEACQKWCDSKDDVVKLKPAEKDELRQRLEAGDVAFLEGLGVAEADATDFVGIDLHSCDACGDFHTITAKLSAMRPGKDGKLERSDTSVVTKLIIDREQAKRVNGIAAKAGAESKK